MSLIQWKEGSEGKPLTPLPLLDLGQTLEKAF